MIKYYLFKIGVFLSKFIPRNISLQLAEVIGVLAYFIAFKKKKVLKLNFKLFLEDKKISAISLKIFQNYAKYFVDLVYLSRLTRKEILKLTNITGKNFLDEALTKKRGIILATAHFGNWDMGGVILASLKYPINAVAEFLKPKKLFDFYTDLRTKNGVKIISLGNSPKNILKKLKEEEIVALLCDRVIKGNGVEVNFFSKKVLMPAGAVVMALRTKTVILPSFTIKEKNNAYRLIVLEPLKLEIKETIKETIELNTQKLIKIIEEMILQYPDQWYMLQPLKILD